jgi:hypothetical protein
VLNDPLDDLLNLVGADHLDRDGTLAQDQVEDGDQHRQQRVQFRAVLRQELKKAGKRRALRIRVTTWAKSRPCGSAAREMSTSAWMSSTVAGVAGRPAERVDENVGSR